MNIDLNLKYLSRQINSRINLPRHRICIYHMFQSFCTFQYGTCGHKVWLEWTKDFCHWLGLLAVKSSYLECLPFYPDFIIMLLTNYSSPIIISISLGHYNLGLISCSSHWCQSPFFIRGCHKRMFCRWISYRRIYLRSWDRLWRM